MLIAMQEAMHVGGDGGSRASEPHASIARGAYGWREAGVRCGALERLIGTHFPLCWSVWHSIDNVGAVCMYVVAYISVQACQTV